MKQFINSFLIAILLVFIVIGTLIEYTFWQISEVHHA